MSVRVLVVEDSQADRLSLERALTRDPDTPWEVEVAGTAEEALQRLEAGRLPEALVLDVNLPGLDGVSLLQTVRRRYAGRSPAVVFLSGSGSERVAVEAMKAGAQDYLVKDGFSPERLRHSLRNAVEAVRLARELEERRLQAERAERLAREALAVRDEFFAMATHDLKGPLMSISLGLQSLRMHLPPEARTPKVEERLELVLKSTERMSELIHHFLELSKGRERPLAPERVDLLALVRAKVRELSHLAGTHPVQLRVEGLDFTGQWDGASLERVLENLLGNAVKYSPRGGPITLTLSEDASGPQGWVRLRVEDRGIGIPAADLPHIFERFRRGKNVDPGMSGSGVGLASVKRMVDLHGGTFGVESQEGQGSAFTVRLPRTGPPSARTPGR
jgi:signal transduction histidine kinase